MKNFKLLSKRMHIHEQVEVIMKNQDDPPLFPSCPVNQRKSTKNNFHFLRWHFPKSVHVVKNCQHSFSSSNLSKWKESLKLLQKDLMTYVEVFLVLQFSSAQFVDPIVDTANQYLRALPFFWIGCLDLLFSIDQPHPIYRQAEYHQQVWLKLVTNQWHEIAHLTTVHR